MKPVTNATWKTVLARIAPAGRADILASLSGLMPELIKRFEINTTLRQAHFLAQCAQESDGFRTTREYASGAEYEGRKDLGNTQAGDGVRFKGRGLIQTTGRHNYVEGRDALGVDIVSHPELAEKFPLAGLLAGLYWHKHGCNALADEDDVVAVTKRVNGGTNGLLSRKTYLARAKAALAHGTPVAPVTSVPAVTPPAPATPASAPNVAPAKPALVQRLVSLFKKV